jgi:hypothetical protein
MADDLRIDFFEPYDPVTGNQWAGDFPRRRLASRIQALVGADRAELRTDPTKWLLPKVVAADKDGATFIDLYRVRSDRWPYLRRQGKVSPLDAMLPLDDDDGLADVTHFGFFPGNVVVTIFNQFGPRATNLSRYMLDKTAVDVEYRAVPRDDMLDTLNKAAMVKRFNLRFASNQADVLAGNGGDFASDAARLAGNLPQTDIEIMLTVHGSQRSGQSASRIKAAIGQILASSARNALKRAAVQIGDHDDYGRAVLDLLEEDIILTRPVPPGVRFKRYIGEDEAVAVLRDAYRTMNGELTRALGDLVEEASSEDVELDLPPVPDDVPD